MIDAPPARPTLRCRRPRAQGSTILENEPGPAIFRGTVLLCDENDVRATTAFVNARRNSVRSCVSPRLAAKIDKRAEPSRAVQEEREEGTREKKRGSGSREKLRSQDSRRCRLARSHAFLKFRFVQTCACACACEELGKRIKTAVDLN